MLVNGRGPFRLVVAAGEKRCVALRFVSDGAGAHAARLAIVLGEKSDLVLLESYEGDGDYLTESDIDFTLEAGAGLERVVIAAVDAPERHFGVASGARIAPWACGTPSWVRPILTAGRETPAPGDRAYRAILAASAAVRLDGLYLLSDKRHADITTVVEHAGVDGATNQLIKGAVRDQARGVFQGRIVVQARAALPTAPRPGWAITPPSSFRPRRGVDAKPELEIYADDVDCAHGNTLGALDEEALFYARQRGIPEARGPRHASTAAFLAEVVDRIEHRRRPRGGPRLARRPDPSVQSWRRRRHSYPSIFDVDGGARRIPDPEPRSERPPPGLPRQRSLGPEAAGGHASHDGGQRARLRQRAPRPAHTGQRNH